MYLPALIAEDLDTIALTAQNTKFARQEPEKQLMLCLEQTQRGKITGKRQGKHLLNPANAGNVVIGAITTRTAATKTTAADAIATTIQRTSLTNAQKSESR